MGSIPKLVGILSYGVLLCLSFSSATQAGNTASAAKELKADSTDRKESGQEAQDNQQKAPMTGEQLQNSKTIAGEVLRVEGENYFVNGQDGKEVRLHTDDTTIKIGNIRQGDQIEADVNDQNHALSIRSTRETDMDLPQ